MENLQKAIIKHTSNKENTAKKTKTKTSDIKENEKKIEFEIKNDSSELCIIAQKDIHGVEYLLVNMKQISLFDTIYTKEFDTLHISGKKYTIFDVKSDNSCCFHTLSLVLSHWNDLHSTEYMNGMNLRNHLALVMSTLLKNKVQWIINAFSVLTDCKTRQDRFKYIHRVRERLHHANKRVFDAYTSVKLTGIIYFS